MARNYWMFVQSPEDFEISQKRKFSIHGMTRRQRRRAQRMAPDDRVLYYISSRNRWAVSGYIKSTYFEDVTPIWKSDSGVEKFPYRVNISPTIVLREHDYIDAMILGPRLTYLKRWSPERWPLAFFDTLHLLPQKDFNLVENEMSRVVSRKEL